MFVAAARLDVRLLQSGSLKEKRAVLRSVKERCYIHLKVPLKEVGQQDDRSIARLGFAIVDESAHQCETRVQQLLTQLESWLEQQGAEVFDIEVGTFVL